MKKNVYLIIGEGKCGKSGLVRALTGKYKNGPCIIRSASNTNLEFMVWSNSPQEAGKSPQRVLKEINRVGAGNILLTLRFEPSPETIRFNAIDYVNLIGENHRINHVIFMSEEEQVSYFQTSAPANILNLCSERPVNANADMVRRWWNWL